MALLLKVYPDTAALCPSRFEFGVRSNANVDFSLATNIASVTVFPGILFLANIQYPGATNEMQREREAFWFDVGAQQNTVALWHLERPVPHGTMRGAPTLAGAITRGDTTVDITGTGTLLNGDMFSIGASYELFMCIADVDLSLTTSVPVSRPAYNNHSAGLAVNWDKPKGEFIVGSSDIFVPWVPGRVGDPFSVSLIELP